MQISPLILLHVCSAVVALLAGFMSMALRKGGSLHRLSGTVFFVAMLSMSSSAAYLAVFHKPNRLNLVVGLLTFYLVTTAWRAARQRAGGTGMFDLGALLYILAVAALGFGSGFEAAAMPRGIKDGVPAVGHFIFASAALLCAVSDIRMMMRGGAVGPRRIARHLWRMSSALLIATLSFYPGQARLFPQWLRDTNLLMVPAVLLIGSMLFWMVRVRGRGRKRQTEVNRTTHTEAVRGSSQWIVH